ncbi:hypothetical protein SAMN04488541_100845 [Thermoflexibacter ruber]|uniref:Uncharacterized protein n=1 Tax=Thermoflexibacter ruber TaxID=1003 RepID=A0A1I2DW98_9BACT|nr:hypothetical protein SAMN04488541_100845 [Thermoflexibacter ruber]
MEALWYYIFTYQALFSHSNICYVFLHIVSIAKASSHYLVIVLFFCKKYRYIPLHKTSIFRYNILHNSKSNHYKYLHEGRYKLYFFTRLLINALYFLTFCIIKFYTFFVYCYILSHYIHKPLLFFTHLSIKNSFFTQLEADLA